MAATCAKSTGDGVPSFARVHNSPAAAATRNTSPAIYVQDVWTRDRLTLSGGLRFDWMHSTNDMGGAGGGCAGGAVRPGAGLSLDQGRAVLERPLTAVQRRV